MVFPLALAAAILAADEPARVDAPMTPWYLPRYGTAQVFITNGAVAPALRLGWELSLIDQPRNVLAFTVELGLSYTTLTPKGVGLLWQHPALFGLGYRMLRESGLYWGFTVGFGPVLYGHKGDKDEQKVNGYVEGRLHLGLKISKVTLSLCGGYAQWIAYDARSVAQQYLGGPFVGVMLGWR